MIFPVIFKWAAVVGFLSFIGFIVLMVLGGRANYPLLTCGAILIFTSFSTALFFSPATESGHISKYSVKYAENAIEENDAQMLLDQLKGLEMLAMPESNYVLMQMVSANKEQAPDGYTPDGGKLRLITQEGNAFTPTPEALFAIENAVFSRAKSPAVKEWHEAVMKRSEGLRTGAVNIGIIAACFSLLAVVLMAIARNIKGRVSRIEQLSARLNQWEKEV